MRACRVIVAAADEDARHRGALGGRDGGHRGAARAPGGRLDLLAYFGRRLAGDGRRPRLPAAPSSSPTSVPDVDWVARFRENFRAFRAGRFLVAPPWDAAGGRRLARPARVDPGRAFGTGTHETTRLCLAALEALARRRRARPHSRPRLRHRPPRGRRRAPRGRAPVRVRHRPRGDGRLPPPRPPQRGAPGVVRADGGRGFRPGSFDLVLANLMAPLLDRALGRDPRPARAPGGRSSSPACSSRTCPPCSAAFAACGTPLERRDGEWAALVYETPARELCRASTFPRPRPGARVELPEYSAHHAARGAAAAGGRRRPRLRRRRARSSRPSLDDVSRRTVSRPPRPPRGAPRPSRLCRSSSPSRRSRATAWSSSSRRRPSSASPRSGRSSPTGPTPRPGPPSRARAPSAGSGWRRGAAEQCGRAVVPRIAPTTTLDGLLARPFDGDAHRAARDRGPRPARRARGRAPPARCSC